jgi:DNA-binding XRE family transcriptional regulator
MSAKPLSGNNPYTITEVLQAFFQLDTKQQQEVQKQIQRVSDSQISSAERDLAEKTLAAMLRTTAGKHGAGRVLNRDERFGPAHHELRARMEQVEEAFATTLARLMAERQLTQAQLAERIGVGQSAISMLLKRRCRPQRRTIGKLAEALGVPVEELWPGFHNGWQSGLLQ